MRGTEFQIARRLGVLFLLVYLLTASLRIDSAGGEARYWVACNLISRGDVSIPYVAVSGEVYGPRGEREPEGGYGEGAWGRDGRYYAKYGLGWSLVAAPFCGVGRLIGALLPGQRVELTSRVFVMMVNPLVTAASMAMYYLLLRTFFSRQVSLYLTTGYGVGTIAWYYAKSAFSEPLVVLLMLAALLLARRERWDQLGLFLGGMVLTRQTALLLALPLLGWGMWRLVRYRPRGWLQSVAFLAGGLALGQLMVWGYNTMRFGSPLDAGYRGITWDTPLWLGLHGQWWSSGKGLLVFMPMLWLGVLGWHTFIREHGHWGWVLSSMVVLFSLPQAIFNHWNGGGGWGLRLLLPVVPLVLLPGGETVSRWRRTSAGQIALAGVLAVSILFQVFGVSVNWGRHLQRVWDRSATPAEYNWRINFSWVDSPLAGQVVSLREAVQVLRDPVLRSEVSGFFRQTKDTPWRDRWSEAIGLASFNVPDFWWVYGWLLGGALWILGGLVGVLASCLIKTLRMLRQQIEESL